MDWAVTQRMLLCQILIPAWHEHVHNNDCLNQLDGNSHSLSVTCIGALWQELSNVIFIVTVWLKLCQEEHLVPSTMPA